MKKNILLLLLLIAGMTSVKADNITVDGVNRTYNVYAPNNLGENRPLLIFCHGYGQDANWMQYTEFKNDNVSMEAVCDTAKFVVVFPNGINKAWDISGNSDINFIKAIIDKMATQHKIDRNRVYLGGFSMGGMLTYHAMNKISDLIAAFAPCSGYPMGGATADANARAIPILHIHGTADETCAFSGAQPALNVWIAHNGCSTTERVVNNYNGFNGCKMHIWGGGKDGSEVRLLELPNKGHWISKEPQVYTGKEIWNFCKNFSLYKTAPSVKITSPSDEAKYVSYGIKESVKFPDITITATAEDPNGTIEKVEFYDGSTLIATCTQEPYQATLSGAKSGKHKLQVVATDNDGETARASVILTLQSPTMAYSLTFTEGGAIPAGWTLYDNSEKRSGYSSGYTSGCRVLQLTGSPRGFSYGLYFRNINGSAHQGWAKYGLPEGGHKLSMAPGHYKIKYKACNWNMANFGAIELNIENLKDNSSVAKQTYTPNINIGNSTTNSFGTPTQQVFEFDITEQGDYAIAFYCAASGWSDGIIGQFSIENVSYAVTGITSTTAYLPEDDGFVYNLQGQRFSNLATLKPGIYISSNGKKIYKE